MTRRPELRDPIALLRTRVATVPMIAIAALATLQLAGCATRSAGRDEVPGATEAPVTTAAPAHAPVPTAQRLTGVFAPDSSRSESLAPGVAYSVLHMPSGPWLVHVVEVAPNACGVELHTVKSLDHVVGRERPSEIARRTAAGGERRVLAAVNADFFNFTPPGVSEGPQVSGGRVVKSEDSHRAAVPDTVLREQPVFGVSASGKPFLADAHLDGWVRVDDATRAPLTRVNRAADSDSLTLYNSFLGDTTPGSLGVVELIVRTVRAAEMAGDTAVGVITALDTLPAGVTIPPRGIVLSMPARALDSRMDGAHARGARPAPQPGDSVWWSLPFRGAPARVKELTGGYPMLLRHGESVLERFADMIPGFSDKEHPRTAVALRPDGTVLLVAVDGRSESSGGMSLAQLTEFLTALGATDALNLDGGGSTVLALEGEVVSHPSDKEGERAVSNALLVLGGEDRCD